MFCLTENNNNNNNQYLNFSKEIQNQNANHIYVKFWTSQIVYGRIELFHNSAGLKFVISF